MLPDETEAEVVEEIRAIVTALSAADPTFEATVQCRLHRPGYQSAASSPVAGAVHQAASTVLGAAPRVAGVGYWMDAALLGAAGIDTVTIGPSGGGAHADVEWVDLRSVEQVADILARSAREYCGEE